MIVESGSSQLFNLLILTLQMLSETGENMKDDNLADYLAELEGDYYTFLHIHNLLTLKNALLIDDELISQITNLRKLLTLIDNKSSGVWNAKGFKESAEWLAIHEQAKKILRGLKH